jgi:bacillithiol biosynthesis deacetylase BshB1
VLSYLRTSLTDQTEPLAPPVDLLAIAAHRDDVELLVGGTMARTAAQGHRTGILDLTMGERGTDGSAQLRGQEADAAARVLGVTARRNAGLPDAGLVNTPETRSLIAGYIRAFRPRVVILPFTAGRHPDHRVASQLAYDACFLAGLARYDAAGEPHRPHKLLYALTYREDAVKPSFVVDITDFMETKMEAVRCYHSQFDARSTTRCACTPPATGRSSARPTASPSTWWRPWRWTTWSPSPSAASDAHLHPMRPPPRIQLRTSVLRAQRGLPVPRLL